MDSNGNGSASGTKGVNGANGANGELQGEQGRRLEPQGEAAGAPSAQENHTAELERQARETLRAFKESTGDLGSRVRQALSRAGELWDDTHPGEPEPSAVAPGEESRARRLAQRWVQRDFLVDPELPRAMRVLTVQTTAIWKVELRERGESRTLAEAHEPYTGQRPPVPVPVLPVWDYDLPHAPEIEAGERRERLPGMDQIGACLTCNGSGHRPCAACEGKGFTPCPTCHGRARVPCRRCHGRGRIPDPVALRRQRAAKGYWQVRAERLAADAGGRLADFAERLRQDYGVPLPPSAEWAPGANVADTIACPDCVNGTVPCACGAGKRVCATCHGTSTAACPACNGSSKVVWYRQLVRRFDTRVAQRALPLEDPSVSRWLTDEVVRKASGEDVWEGGRDALSGPAPEGVPAAVWQVMHDFADHPGDEFTTMAPASEQTTGERRVIAQRVRVTRVSLAQVEYAFAGKFFSFVAAGGRGAERFWSEAFPPRWSRVGRFLRALSRDLQLQGEHERRRLEPGPQGDGTLSSLEEFRARREQNGTANGDSKD